MEEQMTMNRKERERLKVMARLVERTITQRIAAEQLKIGERQLRRLFNAYKESGDIGLVSKKRGKKSNNHLATQLERQVLELIQMHYANFGPTLIQEKLTEVHQLQVSVSTVRTLMTKHKIWQPRKWKAPKVHQRRARKECFGEMGQMDGSYHDWFQGRAPECCLLVLVDDATSRLLWLKFVKWESCFGYFGMLKEYIKIYGRPLSLYTD